MRISTAFRSIRVAAYTTVITGLMVTAGAWAQDTSVSTTSQTGAAKVSTDVQSAVVQWVSGNDLVVKMADGQVRHLTVPPGARATVDGKEIGIDQVKPGMTLTRTITTTTVPKTVTTVRTIEGRVWQVNAPSTVILQFPDGSPNKQYRVPSGQQFNVDGQMRDVFHLRRGMNISATVVTETPMQVANQTREVTGSAPPPPPLPPPQPAVRTVLLIEVPTRAPAPAPEQTAKATLPKTASELPLIGLVGLLLLTAGLTWKKLDA